MNFDATSSGRKRMPSPALPTKREALGLPDRRSVEIAFSFADIAKKDLRASKVLYEKRLYSQSIFQFQQSVEKAAKAVGLLLSLVRPTKEDLTQEVGHTALLSVLLRRRERLAQLRKNLGTLAAAEGLKEGRELLMRLGLPFGIPEPLEMEAKLKDETIASEEADYIRRLKSHDLWKITLESDPGRPPNSAILKLLNEAETQWDSLDRFQKLFEQKLARLMSDPDTLRYILNIYGKALPEVAPLALITMWHERETRYPPLDPSDYWDPSKYTASSGLIRIYPRLHKHARRLCDGALAGARSARIL
jgi:hypothetical protein